MSQIELTLFTLGDWQTNCYVASAGQRCWIIDAGFKPQPLIDHIRARGLTPELLVLTHGHVDHIAGVAEVRAAWPELPILIHEAEREFLSDAAFNMSLFLTKAVVAPDPTQLMKHGDTLSLNGATFEVRHTPGHSPGGVCLYHEPSGQAIVGDTLFAGSVGRHDFPTSDGPALMRSIQDQLLTLPDETRVFPGHGPATTVGHERQNNPYLQGMTAASTA